MIDPAAGVGPDVDFFNGSDGAVGDPLGGLAEAFTGMALVAHLGGDGGFLGDFGDLSDFPDVVGEGFFAVDVFAHLHGSDGDVGMEVVGGGAEDGVDGFFLIEHFAEVDVVVAAEVGFFFGVVFFDFGFDGFPAAESAVVEAAKVGLFGGIGEGDDLRGVLVEEVLGVGTSLAAGADDGDVDFFGGGDEFGTAEDVTGEDGEGGSSSGGAEELTTVDLFGGLFLVHGDVVIQKDGFCVVRPARPTPGNDTGFRGGVLWCGDRNFWDRQRMMNRTNFTRTCVCAGEQTS